MNFVVSFLQILSEDLTMRTSIIALAVVVFWSFSATLITDAQGRRGTRFSNWSAPVNLGPPINTEWDDNVPVLSRDEKTLYFTSDRPGSQYLPGSTTRSEDIWVSKRQNKNAPWGEPVNLGTRINTPYNDRMRSISADGKVILFQSNRTEGGLGLNDIWAMVRKNPNDDFGWSQPVNLGPVINTEYNEVAAKYLFDEQHGNGKLFFSSARPFGFGGPDIYFSEITENGFATPVNVFELNTGSIESCFWVRDDGLEIIFSTNRPDVTLDQTKFDLWVSTRASVYENWSPPESLGPTVNTEGTADVNPMLASEDRVLYFASLRPNPNGPAGNTDIYFSTRARLLR